MLHRLSDGASMGELVQDVARRLTAHALSGVLDGAHGALADVTGDVPSSPLHKAGMVLEVDRGRGLVMPRGVQKVGWAELLRVARRTLELAAEVAAPQGLRLREYLSRA